MELDKLTDWPPAGADVVNVTVAVVELPPSTEAGERLNPLKTGATVRVACSETDA